jgi:hypothetical protein
VSCLSQLGTRGGACAHVIEDVPTAVKAVPSADTCARLTLQDLLYMPRGTIHQAEALETEHSLHVTVSINQVRTAMPTCLAETHRQTRLFFPMISNAHWSW